MVVDNDYHAHGATRMPSQSPTSVRFTPAHRAWIERASQEENRTLNGVIVSIIDEAMKAYPLQIFVHHCKLDGDEFFSVSVGKHGDDFHEGPNKEQAVQAARAKAKELGLPISSIAFNRVGDHAGEVPRAAWASIEDVAVAQGKRAAMRMFMRDDPKDQDLEEIITQAEAVLDAALEGMIPPPDVPLREHTRALLTESYKAELVRLRESG